MKKLKSVGFAVLYLAIPFLVQIVIGMELMVQMLIMEWRGGQISDQAVWKLEHDSGYNLILVTLVNLVLIAGMGLWYYFIRKRRDVSKVDYRKIFSVKSIACLAVLALCAQFACNIIMGTFYLVFPKVYENYTELMEGLDINVLPAWATLFIVAVWAPLAEEIVFRAMLFRTLRKGFAFIPAAVMSGVAFGIYHLNWIQGVYASLFGILLAVIYEKTNSLLGAYLFHLLFNLMNYVIIFVQEHAGIPDVLSGLAVLGLTVLAVPGTIYFTYLYSRMFRRKKDEEDADI